MSTPTPLAAAVEQAAMDETALWRRALGDGRVTTDEALTIFEFRRTHLPELMLLTTSMHVIGGIARGEAGIESPRVQRTLREWMARKAATVVPFRRRGGGELPPAA